MRSPIVLAVPLLVCACQHADVAATSEASRAAAVDHVLLVSVDGLHAVDLDRFVDTHPHSTLASLSARGLTYANARAPHPTDSFPGLLAMVTGGSPASTGVWYDDSYDRRLSPPGSDCSTRGTELVYDESIDFDDTRLDGGGGIDPSKLPRDPDAGCAPVYPHQLLGVNTVFEVIKDFGGTTAWSDKHPAYDLVNGPSGRGVDDLYTPEIASTDGTLAAIEAYDDLKVKHVVDLVKDDAPTIFGLNFQAVSVAQKTYGYRDALATPTAQLQEALEHTDRSLGRLVAALHASGIASRTLVIVSAKHGQSPIDPTAKKIVSNKIIPAIVDGVAAGLAAQVTEDDVALVWLTDAARGGDVAAQLSARRDEASIGEVLGDEALEVAFGKLGARRPDLIVLPRTGVVYAKPTASKIAEHGGFGEDDDHVALLVSNPSLRRRTLRATVATASIAPTILQALRIPVDALDAVDAEGTPPLPGLR